MGLRVRSLEQSAFALGDDLMDSSGSDRFNFFTYQGKLSSGAITNFLDIQVCVVLNYKLDICSRG